MGEHNRRYYWLKLKEDFFDDDAITWLEEQSPNGKEYSLFYLKLCLRSLKSNGVLIRKVGDVLIPYDIKKIAEITKTDENIASAAINLLSKIGYIQVLDSGGLFLTQIENMTGSETPAAERQRKSRASRGVTMSQDSHGNVTNKSQNSHTEIREERIEKDIDKDKEFEKFWSLYPRQIGRDGAYIEWGITINRGVNSNEIIEAVKNYANDVSDYPSKYIKHPKNFLADKTYVTYLPNEYTPRPQNVTPLCKPTNKFNTFPQREYKKDDYQKLENRLINKAGTN